MHVMEDSNLRADADGEAVRVRSTPRQRGGLRVSAARGIRPGVRMRWVASAWGRRHTLGLACVLRAAMACAAVTAALGVLSGSAVAYSQRGHAFGFSVGSRGSGPGKLLRPAAVAVDEVSADMYVVDAGNNRVERFGPAGEFVSAWGWGVADGKEELEVCTASCKAGLAGEGAGEFDAPAGIAVDNSTVAGDASRGDVYVLADTVAGNNVIEKFRGTGERLGAVKVRAGAWGALGGVAVDGSGRLWLSDVGVAPEEILGFSDAVENAPVGSVPLQVECLESRGLAVDATAGALYVSHRVRDVLGECPEAAASAKAPAVIAAVGGAGETQRQALDRENSWGVAVDQASSSGSPLGAAARGDVYVDNGSSVAAFASDGALVQRFGSEQLSGGSGVAVDSATGYVYVADAKNSTVDVFQPEAPGAPSVDSASYTDLSATQTRLEAKVDPHGQDTHAYFEFGTADCRATPALCTAVPAPPGIDVGASFGAQPVSAVAEGLTPGTRYFYRAVAVNEHGEADGESSFGSFTTLPAASAGLPDGREWELVSPADKFGALIYPIAGTTENGGPASGVIQASADGASVTYAASAPFGEGVAGSRALEATQLVSTRSPWGWATRDIETPIEGARGLQPGAAQEYRAFSSDLSLALVQPFGPYTLTGSHMQEPPLVPGGGGEERGIYLRHGATCSASAAGCYEPLITAAGDTAGTQFGGELEFRGRAPDLNHVVFRSDVALSNSRPSAPGLYEWSAGKPPSEALQLVSVLPGNKRAVGSEPPPQVGDFNPTAPQRAARCRRTGRGCSGAR